MKAKRMLALLLVAMLTGTVLSCQDMASDDTSVSESADTTAPEDTGPRSGVPTDLDLNGETINIWYTSYSRATEPAVDMAGDQIGDIWTMRSTVITVRLRKLSAVR